MSGKKIVIDISKNKGDIPPTFYDSVNDSMVIDLVKLKELIIERYKLLKKIFEQTENQNKLNKKSSDFLINSSFSWDNEQSILNDIASHFFLSVIMCRNETEMRWFIKQETKLFKMRIEKNSKYDMYKILSILGIELKQFDPNQNDVDINKISFRKPQSTKELKDNIFYCNFEQALNLVPTHEFYLHKGKIYIPQNELSQLFRLVFEQKLEKTLNKIKIRTEKLKNDRRIKNIIIYFDRQKEYIMKEEAAKFEKDILDDEKLRVMEDVDKVAEKAFPLCMCLIERHINQYSHLMHFGRLQYTLFLKGAGLPVEEALKFFQQKYSKVTPADKFEKEYAYNIRHSYGLEGKRQNYAPYSCEKIINMNAPSGKECHGCPFKNYSVENMKKILSKCGIDQTDIEEIISKKVNNEFQLACSKFFSAKFPRVIGEGVGNHPNGYFASAMKAYKNRTKENQNKTDNQNKNENDYAMIIEEIDKENNK